MYHQHEITFVKTHVDSGNDDLERLIQRILRSGVDITNGYENWFEIGRAIAYEYGEAGRYSYHQLSRVNEDYKPGQTDRQYDACLRSPGTATKATISCVQARKIEKQI